MPQIILRVDDIGRLPSDPPEQGSDQGLAYFFAWRQALGLVGHPITYAAVPTWVDDAGLERLRHELFGGEEIAVHGWDHARGAVVHAGCMADARRRFCGTKCRSYVPPFNEYDAVTVGDWREAVRGTMDTPVFFGGFPGEHHTLGDVPQLENRVIHLPACKPLYGRIPQIREALPAYADCPVPLVATLHVTWDPLSSLAAFGQELLPSLRTPDAASQWCAKAAITPRSLTAPHYVACRWILDHVRIGQHVLDVGSRYSTLPSLLALHGCQVACIDRDPEMPHWQEELARERGVPLRAVRVLDALQLDAHEEFDVVSCCWSIQHNLKVELQEEIVTRALAALVPGGRLLVVSSCTPGETFLQENRADPQLVLSWDDHERYLIKLQERHLGDFGFFHYDHGTANYRWCSRDQANAVCYELIKDPG